MRRAPERSSRAICADRAARAPGPACRYGRTRTKLTVTLRVSPTRTARSVSVSPGAFASIAVWSSDGVDTSSPSTATITSPVWRPAPSAGLSLRTSPTSTPLSASVTETPRYACWTSPPSRCRPTIRSTVSDGSAQLYAVVPADSLAIWELTPITRPSRSSSGPPEFPWLIAASVWIESLIV